MNSTRIIPAIQLTVVNGRPTSKALQPLSFEGVTFTIVDRNGNPWLQATQIGTALGYADDKAIQRIHRRHADEFDTRMTGVVNLTTPSGKQDVRIFSLRGAHLLGMLSRTESAKRFRSWVLDVLENRAAHTLPPRPQPAYMREAWFAVLSHMAQQMVHRALARALQIHESTLSQVLNGTGKYGAGTASMAGMEARVLHTFCHARSRLRRAAQTRQLTLI